MAVIQRRRHHFGVKGLPRQRNAPGTTGKGRNGPLTIATCVQRARVECADVGAPGGCDCEYDRQCQIHMSSEERRGDWGGRAYRFRASGARTQH